MRKKFPTVDIPQADNILLVGDLLALVDAGIDDRKSLSTQLGIVPRQVNYYKHAARILGFAEEKDKSFVLTKAGKEYLLMKRPAEQEAIMKKAVLESPIFKELLSRFDPGELNKRDISKFIRERSYLSPQTAMRRAGSIFAWLKAVSEIE